MRTRHLVFLLTALSCRQAPGGSNYGAQEAFAFKGFVQAPDAYQMGEKRLDVGAFYEGGFSDGGPIDGTTSFLYIYQNGETVAITSDSTDRVEGLSSNKIIYQGYGWWGFGIHWQPARDMTGWKKMHVAMLSSTSTFADVNIGMNSASWQATVTASTYGYKNDGAWHQLVIPVADFVALDVTAVTDPFVLGSPRTVTSLNKGDALKIDDLYFSAE